MAAAAGAAPDTLVITRPDDWHLHVRDGAGLQSVVPHTAQQYGRAIIMPNLVPPVTTAAAAREYRQRVVAAVPASRAAAFTPLMTCYLTDNTPPEEVLRAKEVRSAVQHPRFFGSAAPSSMRGARHTLPAPPCKRAPRVFQPPANRHAWLPPLAPAGRRGGLQAIPSRCHHQQRLWGHRLPQVPAYAQGHGRGGAPPRRRPAAAALRSGIIAALVQGRTG